MSHDDASGKQQPARGRVGLSKHQGGVSAARASAPCEMDVLRQSLGWWCRWVPALHFSQFPGDADAVAKDTFSAWGAGGKAASGELMGWSLLCLPAPKRDQCAARACTLPVRGCTLCPLTLGQGSAVLHSSSRPKLGRQGPFLRGNWWGQ